MPAEKPLENRVGSSVRIGFIGAGSSAAQHVQILAQIAAAQPIAFCDSNKERAAQAAARFAHYEARAYSDFRKMLEAEALDALYICVPPHAHKDMEVLAAQKGCALFVEKPIGLHLKAAERAAKAIESAGVISSVGYHFRYQASTVQAQNLLKSAPAVAMVAGRWWGGFPQTAWWRRRTQSGGQLHEQATHLIDLARYLIGDISKVYSVGARREAKAFPGSDVFDVSALTCEFANGAIGTFSATCLLHDVTEVDLQLIRKDELLDLRGNYLTLRRAGETTTYSHRNNPFLDENIAFIESVISGKRGEIKCSYSDALQTLRVTLAANQSLKSGKTVKV